MRGAIPIKSSTGKRSASTPARAIDHRTIGDSNRDAGQWCEAAAAYSQHLEAYPEDAAIWIQAGNCFKEAGNFVRSLTAYRKAQQLEPGSFEVHLQLGHLYKVCGQYSAALAAYEKAAALDPGFGEIKHEIIDLSERIKHSADKSQTLHLFTSIEELVEVLRNLPREEDPFAAYFRSVGGYAIDRLA